MKAFGGRGIWFSGFFLLWPGRRGRGQSSGGGKMTDSQEGASTMGGMGSLKVTGVTFGANAIPVAVVGSTGMVHTSLEPVEAERLVLIRPGRVDRLSYHRHQCASSLLISQRALGTKSKESCKEQKRSADGMSQSVCFERERFRKRTRGQTGCRLYTIYHFS